MKKMKIIMALALCATLAATADVTEIWHEGTWNNSQAVDNGSYSAMVGDQVTANSVFGLNASGVSVMRDSGGWSATTISGTFNGVGVDRVDADRAFATTSTGIDYIYDTGSGWVNSGALTTTAGGYTAIDTEAGNNLYMYAAKPGGGMDIVSWTGSWTKYSNIGSASYVYHDLAASSAGTAYRVYAAVTGGGIQRIYNASGWHQDTVVAGGDEYVKLSADGGLSTRVFGLKANGDVDVIEWGGSSWDVTNIGSNYGDISADEATAGYLYAAKDGGGVDVINFSGGWVTTEINSGEYDVIAASGSDNYRLYGNVIPEPATLSLVGILGGGLLWIRRKRG